MAVDGVVGLVSAASVSPSWVSAAASSSPSASSGVGSRAPLLPAERWPFHGPVAGGMLTIPAAELVVAVSTSIAASLFSITTTTPIWPTTIAAPSVSSAAAIASAISVVVVSAVVSGAVAILISPHASAPSAPRLHPAPAGRLHLLLGQGFLHLNLVSIDGVEFHHHCFVCGIVVVEVNKAEAPLLPGLLLRDDFGLLDFTVLGEMLGQVFLLDVVFQSTDEDFLNLGEGLWFVRVFSRHGPLHLHAAAVHCVRPCRHCCVGLLWCRVGHKAETTGPLQLLVHHHHAVGEGTVLLEVFAKTIVVGVNVETSDKKFAKLRSRCSTIIRSMRFFFHRLTEAGWSLLCSFRALSFSTTPSSSDTTESTTGKLLSVFSSSATTIVT
ncbi:hypothetical protein F7725_010492 [Dissostichus mawsoni]|uniref:Uncharacterized protein n=1 Tax=Dissostichus mawsoni TaxID=36200 RepID=A0A7J5XNS6_DISMA|nr:hypothetical protein F7725_010492 [Dissostichus mawsoni]